MRMRRAGFAVGCVLLVTAAMTRAGDDPKGKEVDDQRFESLLAEAMKAPEKTDWKALRAAFSRTTHYEPYKIEVPEQLRKVAELLGQDETKQAETMLLELAERERFMRFDTLALLMTVYQKTGEAEKAEKYKKLLDGILGVLEEPEEGTSFDAPIDVLYVQEEYLATIRMHVKGRSLVVHEGRHFDVFELEPQGDEPAKKIHFCIDLLRNAKPLYGK